MNLQETAVLEAADALLNAFARHDRDRYFEAFAPEATFIFHNLDRVLQDRAAYEAEWKAWETEAGFHVLGCRSTDRHVQIVGDTAVFTHAVETTVSMNGSIEVNRERETIIFARAHNGKMLAVHEHLSAHPGYSL